MATKLKARVGQIAPGIFRVRWSPRILSICDAQRRKDIVYVGFPDKESAEKFYSHILKRRPDWKWRSYPKADGQQFNDGEGITRPRKSERLTEYAYEIKWHRPPVEFIEGLIRWDYGDDIAGHELTELAYRTVNV
ncbi:hypothetical protein [Gloeomargarita sp.]